MVDTIFQKLIVPLLIVLLGTVFDLKGDVSSTKALLAEIVPMVKSINTIQIRRTDNVNWAGEHRKEVEQHNHATDLCQPVSVFLTLANKHPSC